MSPFDLVLLALGGAFIVHYLLWGKRMLDRDMEREEAAVQAWRESQ